MQYYLKRNGKQYGPYEVEHLAQMTAEAKILRQDTVEPVGLRQGAMPAAAPGGSPAKANMPGMLSEPQMCVGDVLRENGITVNIATGGTLMNQIKLVGRELVVDRDTFRWENIRKDQRLILLSLVGLMPLVLLYLPIGGFLTFYAISLYFASIWCLFFYYLFSTRQVDLKTTMKLFFSVQLLVLIVFSGLNNLNIFYGLVDSKSFLLSSVGYILGVGVTEELVKALPLMLIAYRSKEPLVPQTMVFYGLMCGISFGVFEGVQYQMQVNSELDYSNAFFANIARLTSLPFFHSMCTAIAGYFISFSVLKPRYKKMLIFYGIAIPALLHGFYDSLCGTLLGLPVAIVVVIVLNYYINNDKHIQTTLNN